jgi:hypothetical protein
MHSSFDRSLKQPLKVGLLSYKIIAWVCIVFFLGCSIGAYLAGQYGPSSFFWIFILMGVYILVSSGMFTLSEDGVSHKNLVGCYRMRWEDVRQIEIGTQGTFVLHGNGKRFILAPPVLWSGPDKPEAYALLNRKIIELSLTHYPSNIADYKIHKGVKVRNSSQTAMP